jgi:hypothetical protein
MVTRKLASTLALLLLLSATLVGCSKKKVNTTPPGSIQGKVYLESEEICHGFIVATTMDQHNPQTVRTPINPDGSYLLENMPSGPVKIFIDLPPMPHDIDPRFAKPMTRGGPVRPAVDPEKDKVKAKDRDKESGKDKPKIKERDPNKAPNPALAMLGPPEEEESWAVVLKIPKAYLNPSRPIITAFVRPGKDPTHYDIVLKMKPPGPQEPEDLGGENPPPPPPH